MLSVKLMGKDLILMLVSYMRTNEAFLPLPHVETLNQTTTKRTETVFKETETIRHQMIRQKTRWNINFYETHLRVEGKNSFVIS